MFSTRYVYISEDCGRVSDKIRIKNTEEEGTICLFIQQILTKGPWFIHSTGKNKGNQINKGNTLSIEGYKGKTDMDPQGVSFHVRKTYSCINIKNKHINTP